MIPGASFIIEANTISFAEQVLANPAKVIVYFYLPTCAPCQRMHSVMDSLFKESRRGLRIVKVDIAGFPNIGAAFGISSVPTFIAFENGHPKKTLRGSPTKNDFKLWIKSIH